MPHKSQDRRSQTRVIERPSIGLSIRDQWTDFFESQMSGPPEKLQPQEAPQEPPEGGALISAGRGAARGINEVSNLTLSIGRGILKHTNLYKLFGDDEFERDWNEWYERDVADANPFQIPVAEQRPEGWWGAYEAIVQFGVGFAAGGSALRGVRLVKAAPSAVRAAAAGGIADFAFFDAQEERLSNAMEHAPGWMQNPITDFLSADEDDSEALGRLKNALEGAVVGATLDGLLAGLRAIRAVRAHKAGRITRHEAEQAVQENLEVARKANLDESIAELEEDGIVPLYRVAPNNDTGQWEALVNDAARDRLPEGAAEKMVFETPAEANRAAGSFNLVDELVNRKPRVLESPDGPRIELSDSQHAQVRAVTDRILSGADPKDAEELLEGIDFNFGRVTTEDETRALLNSLSEIVDDEFATRTNRAAEGFGQSHAETLRLAQDMIPGTTPEDMVDRLITIRGTTKGLPQTLTAARIMMYGQARRISRISRAVDLDPRNSIAVRAMMDEMDNLANMAVELAGSKSDIARTLNALQIDISDEALAAAREAGEEVPEAAAKPLKGSFTEIARRRGYTAREINAIARSLLLTQGDPHAIMRAMRLVGLSSRAGYKRDPGVWDRIVSFRASMMLYGPKTHATNLVSSTMNAMLLPAEIMLGGFVTGQRAVTRQGWDMLVSPFANGAEIMTRSLQGAKRAWQQNRSILDPRFIKDEHGASTAYSEIPTTFWAKTLAAPGRALVTGDEFVKRMAYLSHVRSQSLRKLRQEAQELGVEWTPKEIEERIYDDLAISVDEGGEANLFVNALQHAREATFTQKLRVGTVGHGIQEMANNNVAVRLILPFVRTPVNIMRHSLSRFPLTHGLMKENREMWRAGGEARAQAAGRLASGTLAYSVAAYMSYTGMITGKGSDNPAIRSRLRDSGWQPYSVRVGNTYISYRRLEPIATPLAIMADFVGAIGEASEKTLEERTTALIAAMTASVTSKTFLIGLTEFFEAVGSGQEHKMRNFMASFATSFAPGFARQMNPDPYWREAETMVDEMYRVLPGLSTRLEPRRNLFGEPVVRTARQVLDPVTGYVNQTMNPFTVIDGRDIDDVQLELANLGKAMTMPRDQLANGGIRLRDRDRWENRDPDRRRQSPYDRWMELLDKPKFGGANLRTDLTRLMRSGEWQTLSPGTERYPGGQRWVLANQMIQQHLDNAWQVVLDEYPSLQRAIQNRRTEELKALFQR